MNQSDKPTRRDAKPSGGFDLPASPIWRFKWFADLTLGIFIGLPATIIGIAEGWWEIAEGWRVFAPVILAALVVLPVYRHSITVRLTRNV